MAGVVADRRRELLIEGLWGEPLLTGAAEVDLHRIKSPGRERVGVLLVVAQRPNTLPGAATGPRVGVDPGQQAVGMKPRGQPRQPVGPLHGVDDQLAGGVSLPAAQPKSSQTIR